MWNCQLYLVLLNNGLISVQNQLKSNRVIAFNCKTNYEQNTIRYLIRTYSPNIQNANTYRKLMPN